MASVLKEQTAMREDPRITRTRETVIKACLEILENHGPEGLTHHRIAAATSMSPATIYRHWPKTEDILFELLAQIVIEFEVADDTPLDVGLAKEIKHHLKELNQPLVRIAFTTVISRAHHEPAAAELRERFLDNIYKGIRRSIRRGIQRGELGPSLDPEKFIAEVMGAMIWESFIRGKNVETGFVDEVIEDALARSLPANAEGKPA